MFIILVTILITIITTILTTLLTTILVTILITILTTILITIVKQRFSSPGRLSALRAKRAEVTWPKGSRARSPEHRCAPCRGPETSLRHQGLGFRV